jgi:hypothetical protein
MKGTSARRLHPIVIPAMLEPTASKWDGDGEHRNVCLVFLKIKPYLQQHYQDILFAKLMFIYIINKDS